MRFASILVFAASSAAAWEFSPTPICTLRNETGNVVVTYDAQLPGYTITITRPAPGWADAPIFGMRFDGARPMTIQTDQHKRSADGRQITAADVGFENVLNGLALNTKATAFAGATQTEISLSGIGPAIRAFRRCPDANLS